jgi:hypothetical protein
MLNAQDEFGTYRRYRTIIPANEAMKEMVDKNSPNKPLKIKQSCHCDDLYLGVLGHHRVHNSVNQFVPLIWSRIRHPTFIAPWYEVKHAYELEKEKYPVGAMIQQYKLEYALRVWTPQITTKLGGLSKLPGTQSSNFTYRGKGITSFQS